MKKFSSIALMALCGMLFATAGFAIEETTEKKRVPVGTRLESQESKDAHQQQRADMMAKGANEAAALPKNMKSLSPAIYYTLHPGAYHTLTLIFVNNIVEFEDGSQWSVRPDHAYVTLSWHPSDIVAITPNHSWFSSYNYTLTNQNTGEAVNANLYLGPIYNGPFTHWIAAIDYYNNIIYLEDGSRWSMSSFDSSIVYSWVLNDTVIIGVNDGLFSSSRPNILINVNTLTYAAGAATY